MPEPLYTVIGDLVGSRRVADRAAVQDAFSRVGRDPAAHTYFGESVLRRAYRGRGLGVAFLAAREAQTRATGHRTAAFCATPRRRSWSSPPASCASRSPTTC